METSKQTKTKVKQNNKTIQGRNSIIILMKGEEAILMKSNRKSPLQIDPCPFSAQRTVLIISAHQDQWCFNVF